MKKDLKAMILKEHSKRNALHLAAYLYVHPGALKEYMTILFGPDPVLARRAAWSLANIARDQEKQLLRYFPKFISILQDQAKHPAMARNILQALQEMEIPEKHAAALIDICFHNIMSEAAAIAVRAYSLSLAARLCKPYPELTQELLAVMAELKQRPLSAGMRVRLRDAYKYLGKTGH